MKNKKITSSREFDTHNCLAMCIGNFVILMYLSVIIILHQKHNFKILPLPPRWERGTFAIGPIKSCYKCGLIWFFSYVSIKNEFTKFSI